MTLNFKAYYFGKNICLYLFRAFVVTLTQNHQRLITKWLKDSGLKINETKPKSASFIENDHAPITISINGVSIKSKSSINF